MPAIVLPDPAWMRAAQPWVDMLARQCGLSDSGRAVAIVAEAMQAAAESQWGEEVLRHIRNMEDSGK